MKAATPTDGQAPRARHAVAPGSPLSQAITERFAIDRRRAPVVLASVAVFGAAWRLWAGSSALALAIGLWCGYCCACIGLALLARICGRRIENGAGLACCASALLVSALAGRAVEASLWTLHDLTPAEQITRCGWHLAFVLATIASPISQSLAITRRLARSEAARAQTTASLLALQAQIEPHFLFNTLGTLRSLIRRDASAAADLLDRMTALFRAVLPEVRQTDSTLRREAAIVEAYLAIMSLRFGERLHCVLAFDPASLPGRIPPLLLQPLVENAIEHGIAPSEGGGHLRVVSRVEAGQLVIEVSNTGEPLAVGPAADDGRAHVGLANLRDRLSTLCGPAGSLTLATAHDGSTLATLRLPFATTA